MKPRTSCLSCQRIENIELPCDLPHECHDCKNGSNYKKTDKPPLGIKPRWMMLEHRNREIIEAMHRRVDACMDNSEPITLDPQWIMELLENNKELLARCEP